MARAEVDCYDFKNYRWDDRFDPKESHDIGPGDNRLISFLSPTKLLVSGAIDCNIVKVMLGGNSKGINIRRYDNEDDRKGMSIKKTTGAIDVVGEQILAVSRRKWLFFTETQAVISLDPDDNDGTEEILENPDPSCKLPVPSGSF